MADINSENAHKLLSEATDGIHSKVAGIIQLIEGIKWTKVSFTIDTEPIPSHRPRLSGYRVYVPGAAKNMAYFNKHVLPKLGELFITTPCKFDAKIYVRTPKSFSKLQKILAELKILRPWGNIGDVDNFLKSYMDCIQPNAKRGYQGIMENDCLVVDSTTSKYYSITPRTEITIQYMGELPDDLKSIFRLKNDNES